MKIDLTNIPVLTVRQPWASVIVWGYKGIENRNWKTKYRGPILIHAAKEYDKNYSKSLRKFNPYLVFDVSQICSLSKKHADRIFHKMDLPRGRIIGMTNLDHIDYDWPNENIWAQRDSNWHWHLKASIEFENYSEIINGQLGLWRIK